MLELVDENVREGIAQAIELIASTENQKDLDNLLMFEIVKVITLMCLTRRRNEDMGTFLDRTCELMRTTAPNVDRIIELCLKEKRGKEGIH